MGISRNAGLKDSKCEATDSVQVCLPIKTLRNIGIPETERSNECFLENRKPISLILRLALAVQLSSRASLFQA